MKSKSAQKQGNNLPKSAILKDNVKNKNLKSTPNAEIKSEKNGQDKSSPKNNSMQNDKKLGDLKKFEGVQTMNTKNESKNKNQAKNESNLQSPGNKKEAGNSQSNTVKKNKNITKDTVNAAQKPSQSKEKSLKNIQNVKLPNNRKLSESNSKNSTNPGTSSAENKKTAPLYVHFPTSLKSYKTPLEEVLKNTTFLNNPKSIVLKFPTQEKAKLMQQKITDEISTNSLKLKASIPSGNVDPLKRTSFYAEKPGLNDDVVKSFFGAKSITNVFGRLHTLQFATAEDAAAASHKVLDVDGYKVALRPSIIKEKLDMKTQLKRKLEELEKSVEQVKKKLKEEEEKESKKDESDEEDGSDEENEEDDDDDETEGEDDEDDDDEGEKESKTVEDADDDEDDDEEEDDDE